MRVWLATAVLLGGGLFFYAPRSTPVSAQGQATHAAITDGERLRLWFDVTKQAYNCTVTEVRGDYVGCRGSDTGFTPGPQRWYNLRLVAMIERPGRQE